MGEPNEVFEGNLVKNISGRITWHLLVLRRHPDLLPVCRATGLPRPDLELMFEYIHPTTQQFEKKGILGICG
jgi:hypothetical protein